MGGMELLYIGEWSEMKSKKSYCLDFGKRSKKNEKKPHVVSTTPLSIVSFLTYGKRILKILPKASQFKKKACLILFLTETKRAQNKERSVPALVKDNSNFLANS